jgi:hypothetical protein
MPNVPAGSITMNYEQLGTGEPLVLIPYLGADHACCASNAIHALYSPITCPPLGADPMVPTVAGTSTRSVSASAPWESPIKIRLSSNPGNTAEVNGQC